MPTDKKRITFIISLLILGSLLVLFAQGALSGLYGGTGDPSAAISRIDLYSELVGNYSIISVTVFNNDTLPHNFSIQTFYNESFDGSYNITVKGGKTFTYQTDVLYDKVPISETETVNSTVDVAKFVVYLDEQAKPFEEASFVFSKE